MYLKIAETWPLCPWRKELEERESRIYGPEHKKRRFLRSQDRWCPVADALSSAEGMPLPLTGCVDPGTSEQESGLESSWCLQGQVIYCKLIREVGTGLQCKSLKRSLEKRRDLESGKRQPCRLGPYALLVSLLGDGDTELCQMGCDQHSVKWDHCLLSTVRALVWNITLLLIQPLTALSYFITALTYWKTKKKHFSRSQSRGKISVSSDYCSKEWVTYKSQELIQKLFIFNWKPF